MSDIRALLTKSNNRPVASAPSNTDSAWKAEKRKEIERQYTLRQISYDEYCKRINALAESGKVFA